MNVYLTALGCRLNEAELETWSRDLHASGHRTVTTPEQAQVMVLNSCAVTIEAARKSRSLARRLHRKNPEAKLVVTGCYATLSREKVAELTGVDLVISNEEKSSLPRLISEQLDIPAMPSMATEPDGHHMFRQARTRAFIKVQDGCRNRCTFCIVTIARGKERSRGIEEIIEEINALHADGRQEVVLTGVHLGGYGRDLGNTLFELITEVLAKTTIPRIRLGSLEPWDLPEGFWTLWKGNDRLCPHLHLPLQSGSDPVLKRMARRCMVSEYRALVAAARAEVPHLMVTTDLIVGFPQETEEEWAETLKFVEEIGFAHIHIFTYSQRPGTTAARMKGQLTKATKRARSQEAHALASKMKHEHLSRYVGNILEVLWEEHGEELPEGLTRWSGYTDHYLRVETTRESSLPPLRNTFTSALMLHVTETGKLFAKALS